MKGMAHHNSASLPRLSHSALDNSSTSGRKSLVLAHPDENTSGVFTPSALRSHKPPVSQATTRMFAAILFGLFVVVLLFAFLVGINVYQSLNTMAVNEGSQRLEQSFLANTIHSNDADGAVQVGQGPEGKALVLSETVEGSGSYETRIYAYQGFIVQEYSLATSPYTPEKAINLFESNTFDFAYEGSLLTITTDGGSFHVALRSEEGGN